MESVCILDLHQKFGRRILGSVSVATQELKMQNDGLHAGQSAAAAEALCELTA